MGPGSAVTYVVSKGSAVSVPDVLGQTPANAATAISGAGLSPLRGADEYSATVAAGLVSRQDPAAASQVAPLSTVTYVVSKGPAPVSVPPIDGLTADAAATALNGAGLVGVSSSAFSDAVPLGQVFGQSPAAGASVAPGSNVSYVVSLGPSSTVPDLAGVASAAAGKLSAVGLVVGTVSQAYHASVPAGDVISQMPIMGTPVAHGSAVDYVVSLGLQPVASPADTDPDSHATTTASTTDPATALYTRPNPDHTTTTGRGDGRGR